MAALESYWKPKSSHVGQICFHCVMFSANLALGKKVIAINDNVFTSSSTPPASDLNDNDLGTCWSSTAETNNILTVDFGDPSTIFYFMTITTVAGTSSELLRCITKNCHIFEAI